MIAYETLHTQNIRYCMPQFVTLVHVCPPSLVVMMVAEAPEAHTTFSVGADTALSPASTPDLCGVHSGTLCCDITTSDHHNNKQTSSDS